MADHDVVEGDSRALEESGKYEYLPHTADVQFHAWGATTADAFVNAALCMFSYMTDLRTVQVREEFTFEFEVSGADLIDVLYLFLDELLYRFSVDDHMCCCEVLVDDWIVDGEGGAVSFTCVGKGEPFDLSRHPQGTEIKAITFCNMNVIESENRTDVYVVVDI